MRVKMRSGISGSRNGVAWPPQGEVIDLPSAEAADLLALGYVSEVEDVEQATDPRPSEKATQRTSRRK